MAGTLIEVSVLGLESVEDARVAIARLAAVGPIVLLDGLRSAGYSATVSTDSDQLLRDARAALERIAIDTDHAGDSRKLDARAAARLEAAQAEHHAEWLIATEWTLASARACKSLRVICVGPGDDELDPTRPDHRAHSLLDAARFIETSAAFA